MSDAVLDTSVIMAIMKSEAIDERAYEIVNRGVMSTVNLAELYSKLAPLQMQSTPSLNALLASLRRVEVFTPEQARTAGLLRSVTSHAGLSLGDRACLSLALQLGAPAYTLDRNWMRVDVGCPIYCLR